MPAADSSRGPSDGTLRLPISVNGARCGVIQSDNKPRPSLPALHSPPRRTSLVDQTLEAISALLTAGHWRDVLPGEQEMRMLLGVSRVTLRKALDQLAGQGIIRAGGRGKRHTVHGSPAAAAPAGAGERIVRCLSPVASLDLVWSTRVIFDQIQTALRKWDMTLRFDHRPTLWRGDPAARLERLAEESRTACWLLYRGSSRLQRCFADMRLPCLVLGQCHEGIPLPGVEVDVGALGRHAAAEASRRGHRHIAFVVFDPSVASAVATAEGLAVSVSRKGRSARVSVISDDGTVEGLRRELQAALRQSDPPTLVMLASAVQVLPVLGMLSELQMRVPQDVSLIVRDHEPMLRRSVPELTRYSFDWERLGRLAARLASDIADSGSGKVTRRILMPEFIPGQTLAARRAD